MPQITYFAGMLDDLTPAQFQSLMCYLVGRIVNRSNIKKWRQDNDLPGVD